MNISKIKTLTQRSAIVIMVSAFSGPAMSQDLIDYANLVDVLTNAHPERAVTEHSGCKSSPISKSPVNNKSLNPICSICLGDTLGSTTYEIFTTTETGVGGAVAFCFSPSIFTTTPEPLNSQVINDLQAMCDSRGGIFTDVTTGLVSCLFQ